MKTVILCGGKGTRIRGVADNIPAIVKMANRDLTDRVVFGNDPKKLIEKLLITYREKPKATMEDQRVVMPNGPIR